MFIFVILKCVIPGLKTGIAINYFYFSLVMYRGNYRMQSNGWDEY